MGVIDVCYDWEKAHSSFGRGRMEGEEVWTVLFDDEDDPRSRQFLAKGAADIPRMYTSHPYHRWYYVQAIDARPLNGPMLYEVTVHYGALTPVSGSDIGEPVDPLAIPPKWTWPQAAVTEQIDRDINGDPITNSAGETFDPPPTNEVQEFVARVELYRAVFNPVLAWEYRGAVNSDIFLGFPAEKVKCTHYEGEEMQTPGGLRYRIVMEFHVRWDGWKLRRLDEGFREYYGVNDDGTPDYRNILDTSGLQVTEPHKLKDTGRKLEVGGTPHFLEVQTYRTMAFAALGLG